MTGTALVLGGGGITGIAWELGILKGLADAGVDVTGADTVIGTSAGSVVGAQVTGARSLDEVYATQLAPPDHEIGARVGRATMFRLVPPMVVPGSEARKLRRIGRMSMRAHPPGGSERIEVIRSRLGDVPWPDRDLRITAFEAETGKFVTFDRSSGVELVLAVAASCAVPLVWPAVAVDGRHYLVG
ncbi:MAG: patatin-like phospholipase family protein, partial [Nocardioides sp.]